MSNSSTKSLGILALSILAALAPISAFGQAAKVVGEKPSIDDLPSPDIAQNIGKTKAFKPKDWLEIEVKLKIALSPEPRSKTCDKITVKWYVAVKNPDKVGTMLLLTKTVEHINLPLDQDVYCSVYLSPASIKRISGFDRGAKSLIEYVGYEVLINGEKMAAETNKLSAGEGGKPAWWNLTSDNLSRSEVVPLLNKAETPFSIMWWDRYAEVSAERR